MDNKSSKEELSNFNRHLLKALNQNETNPKTMEPYISINKLAEYTQANATRRRQILKSLKEDVDFKKNYYQDVKAMVPKFFKSGYDESIIDRTIKRVNETPITTTWTMSDRNNSILALRSIQKGELPDLSDYEFIDLDTRLDNIILAEVKVTIKPEIYLKHKLSNKLGGIKFHFAKTEKNRLELQAMQHAATLIKFAFTEYGYDLKEIDTSACISIDVFNGNYANSPVAYKRTLESLKCSCEEIFGRWDSI